MITGATRKSIEGTKKSKDGTRTNISGGSMKSKASLLSGLKMGQN